MSYKDIVHGFSMNFWLLDCFILEPTKSGDFARDKNISGIR